MRKQIGMLLLAGMVIGWHQPVGAQEGKVDPAAVEATVPAPAESLASTYGLSREVVDKLSTEQLYSLIHERIRRERRDDNVPEVAYVVPLGFFAAVLLLVGAVLYFRMRRERQLHETVRSMVEKGAAIPAELFTQSFQRAPKSALRTGILLLAVGVGISLFLALTAVWEKEAIKGVGMGLIPAILGIGYLVVWKLEKNGKKSAAS